jgi:hypothetical protein
MGTARKKTVLSKRKIDGEVYSVSPVLVQMTNEIKSIQATGRLPLGGPK